MTSRFLTQREFNILFDKGLVPKDIESGYVVGVSEACNYSMIIEEKKIEGVDENKIKKKFEIISSEIEKGSLWILELTASNISRLLLDEEFYESYCDKRSNPFILSQRISLFYDIDYSHWTDNVYTEAFDL